MITAGKVWTQEEILASWLDALKKYGPGRADTSGDYRVIAVGGTK